MIRHVNNILIITLMPILMIESIIMDLIIFFQRLFYSVWDPLNCYWFYLFLLLCIRSKISLITHLHPSGSLPDLTKPWKEQGLWSRISLKKPLNKSIKNMEIPPIINITLRRDWSMKRKNDKNGLMICSLLGNKSSSRRQEDYGVRTM